MKANHRFVFFLAATAMAASLGCQTAVAAGGQGGTAGGSSTGSAQPSGSGTGPDPLPVAGGNARSADGGVIVTLANFDVLCGAPAFLTDCSTHVMWLAEFELAATDLVPGTTLPLASIHGHLEKTIAFTDVGDSTGCGPSSGPIQEGTVTVDAVSATELTLVVDGTSATMQGAGIDGTYVVPRCGGT